MRVIDRIRELTLDSNIEHGADRITEVMSWCDSPIEQLFILWMLVQGYRPLTQADTPYDNILTALRPAGFRVSKPRGFVIDVGSIAAVQGVVIFDGEQFRADIAIASRAHGRIIVELDGHDFHERTKEQAARDRSRDRRLTADGWRVLRFTGGEIARACETELLQEVWNTERRIADEHELNNRADVLRSEMAPL